MTQELFHHAHPDSRIAEIRNENRGGDVSYKDIEWLCDVACAALHVIESSPGTPDSVKEFLRRSLYAA